MVEIATPRFTSFIRDVPVRPDYHTGYKYLLSFDKLRMNGAKLAMIRLRPAYGGFHSLVLAKFAMTIADCYLSEEETKRSSAWIPAPIHYVHAGYTNQVGNDRGWRGNKRVMTLRSDKSFVEIASVRLSTANLAMTIIDCYLSEKEPKQSGDWIPDQVGNDT